MTRLLAFAGFLVGLSALTLLAQENPVEVRSGFVTTSDGIELHYLEAGSGSSILFVPGWIGVAEFWEPQLDHFARSHHAIALDPRSQGDSEKAPDGNYTERRARDIKEVIDRLGLAPVVVVSWSRAVKETISLIDQFGTVGLHAVVLVDGALGGGTPVSIAAAAARMKTMQLDPEQFLNEQAPGMFKQPHSEEFYQRIIDANLKTPTNTAVVLALEMLELDYRTVLRELERPLMYVRRGDVGATRLQYVETIRAEIPTARIEVFEDSGHALFLDEPEKFNAILEDFIRSIAPR